MDGKPVEKAATGNDAKHKSAVAASQEATGGSQAQLKTEAANAVETQLNSNNINVETVTAIAKFQAALAACMKNSKELGEWIGNQVSTNLQNLIDHLKIPKLYEDFEKLNPILKALVVICILALLYLLHYLTWEAVSFVWSHVMEFIHSESGKKAIESATEVLTSISDSGILAKFSSTFANAADNENANNQSDDNEEPPCFEMTLWEGMVNIPVSGLVGVIQAFFVYFSRRVITTSEKN